MKKCLRSALLCALCAALLCLTTACQKAPSPAGSSGSISDSSAAPVDDSSEDATPDRPTIPDDIPEDMHYLYDFSFSQRYDNRITDQFSLILPDGNTFRLFEKYQPQEHAQQTFRCDGDGMVPHEYMFYWYPAEEGCLAVTTDYYVPDQAEYISSLWSNLPGTKTDLGVAVGSTEKELLLAYTENLFFVEGSGNLSPSITAGYEAWEYYEDGLGEYDCAYLFQPFTQENNECRDMMFYLKDGAVVAIETMCPFELRYVYGYDREAGLRETEARREALS